MRILELWNDGKTAGEIAASIGNTTPKATSGVIARLRRASYFVRDHGGTDYSSGIFNR